MVGIGAERINRLLERYLDFEPEPIDFNDIEWKKGQVGRHENFSATLRMNDQNETDKNTYRPPKEIK